MKSKIKLKAWRCIKDHYVDEYDYFFIGELIWQRPNKKMDLELWERKEEFDKL